MRISKLCLPAAAMAGALALAGCGGGSDGQKMPEPGKRGGGNGDKTLALPTGLTISGSLNSEGATDYTILPGGTLEQNVLQNNRGKVVFTCPADGEACLVTIPVGGSVDSVTYSGGKPEVTEKDDPKTAVNTGVETQPSESTDPLSNDVLLKALKSANRTGADRTVWNGGASSGGDALSVDSANNFTPLGGPKITLWIGGTTDAYYGHWVESTTPVATEVPGKRGVVWGGSTPYGKKPETTLDTATYDNPGGVLLYHSGDGKKWTPGTGDLALTANFGTGMVGGSIGGDDLDGMGTNNANDIALSAAPIGGDGTFSGDAKFSAPGVERQSGSWNGGFFGPTTMINQAREQEHAAPSHVAGEFRVSRAKVGMTQTELHVRGAFGN